MAQCLLSMKVALGRLKHGKYLPFSVLPGMVLAEFLVQKPSFLGLQMSPLHHDDLVTAIVSTVMSLEMTVLLDSEMGYSPLSVQMMGMRLSVNQSQ